MQTIKYFLAKTMLMLLPALALYNPVNAQQGNWYSFFDKKSDLIGYKDASGKIKIKPKFGGITRAPVFKNIIAVTEDKTRKSYYLLKNGKKVGLDSTYVWDMTFDCEQENKIRFRDEKTDKVGFFNTNGKIVINPVYNDARPFYNGLALVIHHGSRVCWDGSPYNPAQPCEHWEWEGTTAFIDTQNRIVADSINMDKTGSINWYSLKISDTRADSNLYVSFKAVNGKFYSFIDYEKEFKQWFYKNYLTKLSARCLQTNCYKRLTLEGIFKNKLRNYYSKASFFKSYQPLLLRKMQAIKNHVTETSITIDDLNSFIYEGKDFKAYFTACGEFNKQQYPLFDVMTTYYNKNKQINYQEHFSFLRTGNGYKLIGLALKNTK